MGPLCHAHKKASTCVYCNGEGDLALHFLGVLDVDIVYCGQLLSYHVVKHPFQISIFHTPLIFKHAMPFLTKGNDHS
jgi:hypothetical protein